MKTVFKTYSAVLMCFLFGCQSVFTEKFNAAENPDDWIGQSPIALMSAKGNPTQVINDEGYQYIIYMTGDNISFGNNEGDTPAGNFTIVNGYPQAESIGNNFCQQTYFAQNGVIVKAQQQGNGCINVSDSAPTVN